MKKRLGPSTEKCSLYSHTFLVLFLLLLNVPTFAKPIAAAEDTTVVELFVLPSPDEMMDYVGKGNATFQKSLLLNPADKSKLVTTKDKYVALGMYLTDLAYTVGFKQYGSSFKFLQTIDELGKELNVLSPEMEKVKERFLNNMEQPDTLKAIYYELYEMVMTNFYENNRFNHYTLICSGIFVESIFLSMNSVDKNTQDREFKHRVWEQKMVFNHLISMVNKNLDIAVRDQLKSDLKNLGDCFNRYAGNVPPETTKPKRSDNVIIIGYKQPSVDLDLAIPDIKTNIESIRSNWIK